MRYIALDISSNTGYAVFDNDKLIAYDVFTRKVEGFKADIKAFTDLPDIYPYNFMKASQEVARLCHNAYGKYGCSMAVIEHPELGKQRLSQRLLEWNNLAVCQRFQEFGIPFKYLLVADWRKRVQCYLRYWPEHQKWNKEVGKAQKIAKKESEKLGRKVMAKIDGKVVSKINQKKLSIILANEKYGITIKDDNIADAINLGRAAWELELVNESSKLSVMRR